MDNLILREGESPHLNLSPRGEEAEPLPVVDALVPPAAYL